VAIYFLNLKTFGRSNGSGAVSAAAYRSGERLRDERTGRTYDHSERQDVLHKEIILPKEFAADDMSWAKDRGTLWNSAEAAEVRNDARVAREYLVALPQELSPQQRADLVKGFSSELVERYRFAVDVAIHAPRDYPGSDPRNFHAHLLATTREVTLEGLGAKTTLEWNDARRRESGMGPAVGELFHVRERWAMAANSALEQAHLTGRIDHRTLAAQGIDREPGLRIPRAAYEMERHGYRSFVAERLRAEHQARVDARLQRAAEHSAASPERKNPEDIRRQAVENWLRYREAKEREQPQTESRTVSSASAPRKNDHSL
jgi:ATP-dependent exoDNAse (exonuclease V) alpha subunit